MIKATEIYNSIASNNNLAQSNAYSDYWSTLTGLVEETADNKYDYFRHVLQNKLATGKPYYKVKSLTAHTKSRVNPAVVRGTHRSLVPLFCGASHG